MSYVLGSTKPAQLPKQLATRHIAGPAATMSDMSWPTEPETQPLHPVAAADGDADNASLLWPTRVAKLSSAFGYRINPISHQGQVHKGVDVPAPCGTEVVAAEEGIVQYAEYTQTAGNIVTLLHDGGWTTKYLHLSRLHVKPGQHVAAGELIAYSGDTGTMSTGAHLHFEVWSGKTAIDPMSFRYRAIGGEAHPIAVVCEKSHANTAVAAAPAPAPRQPEYEAASSVERMYMRLLGRRSGSR
jgi:murein DD-endopeptidase MepM/ murein hydrolase activator NlpD